MGKKKLKKELKKYKALAKQIEERNKQRGDLLQDISLKLAKMDYEALNSFFKELPPGDPQGYSEKERTIEGIEYYEEARQGEAEEDSDGSE